MRPRPPYLFYDLLYPLRAERSKTATTTDHRNPEKTLPNTGSTKKVGTTGVRPLKNPRTTVMKAITEGLVQRLVQSPRRHRPKKPESLEREIRRARNRLQR